MSDKRRHQLLIDNEVQIDLVWQALRFWGLSIISTALFLCVGIAFYGEERNAMAVVNVLFFEYGPAAAASILVMPLVLMDVFRHSNRFAGPVYRLRTALRKMVDGDPITLIQFREEDYWQDLAADMNTILGRLERAERRVRELEKGTISELAGSEIASIDATVANSSAVFPTLVTATTDQVESTPAIVG